MKLLIAICCAVLFAITACSSSAEDKRAILREEATDTLTHSTVYAVDRSTGLCYAYYRIVSDSAAATRGLTNVACKELEIINDKASCYSKCYSVCKELTNKDTERDP